MLERLQNLRTTTGRSGWWRVGLNLVILAALVWFAWRAGRPEYLAALPIAFFAVYFVRDWLVHHGSAVYWIERALFFILLAWILFLRHRLNLPPEVQLVILYSLLGLVTGVSFWYMSDPRLALAVQLQEAQQTWAADRAAEANDGFDDDEDEWDDDDEGDLPLADGPEDDSLLGRRH
jgi:hypothetical protein